MTDQEVDPSMQRAFTAISDSSKEESEDGEFENQSQLAIEQRDKYDFLTLIAKIDSEDDDTQKR